MHLFLTLFFFLLLSEGNLKVGGGETSQEINSSRFCLTPLLTLRSKVKEDQRDRERGWTNGCLVALDQPLEVTSSCLFHSHTHSLFFADFCTSDAFSVFQILGLFYLNCSNSTATARAFCNFDWRTECTALCIVYALHLRLQPVHAHSRRSNPHFAS